jgi:predicted RNase H-like nuclease
MLDIHTITNITAPKSWFRRAVRWVAEKLSDLWAAHVHALNESEPYRRQLVILTGAVITLLAIAGPIDSLIAAAVATYVAAHTRDEHSSWSSRSTGTSPDFYGEERW